VITKQQSADLSFHAGAIGKADDDEFLAQLALQLEPGFRARRDIRAQGKDSCEKGNSGSVRSVLRLPGGRIKSRADLLGALDVIAVKVDRGRRDRCMPKVVAHGGEICAVFQRTSGMRMPHSVRARVAQFFGERSVARLDHLSRLQEEPAHHPPQPRSGDARACIAGQSTDEARFRHPVRVC